MYINNSVLWWPSGRHDKLISIDDENLLLWSLDCLKKVAQVSFWMNSVLLNIDGYSSCVNGQPGCFTFMKVIQHY